tara:strand:- start:63 stop:494 length:432 start_codon:yes stop_codon:yes gene_type:complete
MKNNFYNFILILLLLFIVISCSNNEKSGECSTFLECFDGTYWTTNNNQSIWTFNDNEDGEYLEVYISGNNCYTYENNFIVNAIFKYQTKTNLSEDFMSSNWVYTVVNDSVIEKSKSTGGNTSYFYKTDKSYLDALLRLDECNN